MKNVLFVFSCPLGDTIIGTGFLTAYHNQFPDEQIYYTNIWPGGLNTIIGNHPFIKIFDRAIHNNIQFSNVYEIFVLEYKKYNISMETSNNMHECIYEYFEKKYGIKIPYVDNIPNIIVDNKTIKKYDKPMCLINHCVAYAGFDTAFWGLNNFYQFVERFKNRCHFISIGASGKNYDGNTIKRELPNVHENLIDKTDLNQLKNLMYNADFVLTGETGINHVAHIEAYKPRHVFLLSGNRISPNKINYKTPNVFDYKFYDEQKTCKETQCHVRSILKNINGFSCDDWCKYPVLFNNELMSCCLSEVKLDTVIKKFDEVLKTYESN